MRQPYPLRRREKSDLPPAGAEITVLTWNLGYGGLGAESAFLGERGRRLRAPSRAVIAKNIAGIARRLGAADWDAALLQEVAQPGFMTRGEDLLGALDAALPSADRCFSPDIETRLPPPPYGLRHGLGAYLRRAASRAVALPSPQEPRPIALRIHRRYALLRLDLPIAGRSQSWAVFNLHFSAFDARTRSAQLAAALKTAEAAYAGGAAVVLGGDWNMALAQTDFAASGPAGCAAWMTPFPEASLPQGWRLLSDPKTPSVRSVDRPYVAGENARAVIDGFVLAPNVAALDCKTWARGFEFSDHQPVTARLRAL